MSEPQLLREALADWADIDYAAYALAICLGLMPREPGFGRDGHFKHVFWSDNPIGNVLVAMLDQLAAEGVLMKRDDPDYQYRWNQTFRGSWERIT